MMEELRRTLIHTTRSCTRQHSNKVRFFEALTGAR